MAGNWTTLEGPPMAEAGNNHFDSLTKDLSPEQRSEFFQVLHTAGISHQDVELLRCCGGSRSSSCSSALRRFASLQCSTCNGTGRAQQYNFPLTRVPACTAARISQATIVRGKRLPNAELVKTEQPCFQCMTGTAFFHMRTRD